MKDICTTILVSGHCEGFSMLFSFFFSFLLILATSLTFLEFAGRETRTTAKENRPFPLSPSLIFRSALGQSPLAHPLPINKSLHILFVFFWSLKTLEYSSREQQLIPSRIRVENQGIIRIKPFPFPTPLFRVSEARAVIPFLEYSKSLRDKADYRIKKFGMKISGITS